VRTSLIAICFIAACGSSPTTGTTTPTTTPSTFKPTSFSVEVTGSGHPVIFIPGLTCDGHIWDATVAHLGGKVQAHVITLAGFAGKPPIDKPLLPTVKDELVEYIKANHLDHPTVVGHSLGGFMTFWIAESAPELIDRGIAVDGAPFLPGLMDPNATVESVAANAKAMTDGMRGDQPKFVAGVHAFMGSMMHDPGKYPAVIEASTKSDPTTTADAMFFLFQTDLRADLGKITAPMVAIVADNDGQVPREALEATWHAQIDKIAHHDLVVIEHAKHFVMLDQPDAFNAALDKALAQK
jgi:pimeloyl-ACP methyl ester carboxylesterase